MMAETRSGHVDTQRGKELPLMMDAGDDVNVDVQHHGSSYNHFLGVSMHCDPTALPTGGTHLLC